MKDSIDFTAQLLEFYDKQARELPFRDNPVPYYTWISEIMLQQTRMETVLPYFRKFIAALPDIRALAQAQDDDLMKLWEGLGYYSRARNLKKAAQIIVTDYGGQMPESYEELLKLPGIGPYTAGAVASIAFGLPVPAVDGNVIRVFSRILAYGEPVMTAKGRRVIHQAVEEVISTERPGDFNQAVMELGATICLPNGAPLCGACPVKNCCRAYKTGTQMDYPVLPIKKNRRIEEQTVLLLTRDGQFLAEKRPEGGLLAGLLQFPMQPGHLTESQVEEWVRQLGFSDAKISLGIFSKHLFSHVEWHMTSYEVYVKDRFIREDGEGPIWIEAQNLYEITLPTAFRSFRRQMEKILKERA